MDSILAFGDSNTWGLVPGSKTYERYSWERRWTGILQRKLKDARILEDGLCGRTTIFEDEHRPGRRGVAALPLILESNKSLNAAVLMLGTNDCKSVYRASANTIGKGTGFLAASDYAKPDDADNEHLNEEGHRAIAVAIYKKLKKMGVKV